MRTHPPPTSIDRRNLLDGELMQIGHVAVRPASSECGEIDVSSLNVLALPLAGVFARHDGPRQHAIATPNHALFISAGRPYRLSFPACIGDRCLLLRFSSDALARLVPQAMAGDGFNRLAFASHTLLPPAVMLARSQLWRRLEAGAIDALDAEEQGVWLLEAALRAARQTHEKRVPLPLGPSDRRLRQVERAMEAIWLQPERKWTLGSLAAKAHVSPSHLAHLFAAEAGISVYGYVVRCRLAQALQAVLDTQSDLTTIGLDAGFASHSHFTARFRALFGHTPQQLRKGLPRAAVHQIRRTVTAPQSLAA